MRTVPVFTFIFPIVAGVLALAQAVDAQVGKTPEETLGNVVRHVRTLPAKKAFGAVCDHVEWNLMYEDIKSRNDKFLVKEKIDSADGLKRYVSDAGSAVADGAKVLVTMSENPFLMDWFKKAMKVAGHDDMGNLAGAAVQHAEASEKGKNSAIPFSRIVSDLDNPGSYLNISVLSKTQCSTDGTTAANIPVCGGGPGIGDPDPQMKNQVIFRLLLTDTRTNNQQIVYVPMVKTAGKWYLKSHLPEGAWKNFNTAIDSTDMQRVIKLARLLKKFE